MKRELILIIGLAIFLATLNSAKAYYYYPFNNWTGNPGPTLDPGPLWENGPPLTTCMHNYSVHESCLEFVPGTWYPTYNGAIGTGLYAVGSAYQRATYNNLSLINTTQSTIQMWLYPHYWGIPYEMYTTKKVFWLTQQPPLAGNQIIIQLYEHPNPAAYPGRIYLGFMGNNYNIADTFGVGTILPGDTDWGGNWTVGRWSLVTITTNGTTLNLYIDKDRYSIPFTGRIEIQDAKLGIAGYTDGTQNLDFNYRGFMDELYMNFDEAKSWEWVESQHELVYPVPDCTPRWDCTGYTPDCSEPGVEFQNCTGVQDLENCYALTHRHGDLYTGDMSEFVRSCYQGGGAPAEAPKEEVIPPQPEPQPLPEPLVPIEVITCNPGVEYVYQTQQKVITTFRDIEVPYIVRETVGETTCGLDADGDGNKCDLNEDFVSCSSDCKIQFTEVICLDPYRCMLTESWFLQIVLLLQLLVSTYLLYTIFIGG